MWSLYATSIILLLATPVLTIALLLVAFERIFGIGIFDPALGGDPVAIPTPVLVLFASGRLHHDSARHGDRERNHHVLLAQEHFRLQVCRARQHGHCRARFSGLGASHVRGRAIGVCLGRVFAVELLRGDSLGDQSFQLDSHALSRFDHVSHADALRARFHRPVHARRADRACSSPRSG